MSLRYKLLAAVLGITVTVLFLSAAVIINELINTHKEFRAFEAAIRERVIRGIKYDPDGLFNDESLFVQHEFIRDVVKVDGEDAKGEFNIGKGSQLQLAEREERIRSLIRQAILDHKIKAVGSEIAIPERRGGSRLSPGGYYFFLDLPKLNLVRPLQKAYIVFLLGLVLIIVVIYVLLSRAVIRPIERLERAAQRVAAGDYSRPVLPAGRNDEIETLIEAFNMMMLEVGSYRANLEARTEEARQQAKAAEKNLVIAQRLASTGKLASGIAHEVNNPLGGMINAARRLLRDPRPDREKQDEYVGLIVDGLTRIQETVKKILRFTPHQVAPQAVDIDTVLRQAIALASHRIEQGRTELVADVPGDGKVFGDPFELQQVFLNLLINALDAVSEKGGRGKIEIHGGVEGGELAVSITDNGVGMNEEQISQAFDFFFTTKDVGEGTGLGLSISHNVIQNHGGRIEIESEEGVGTTMTVVLPLLEADG